jgi:hypothetical protein
MARSTTKTTTTTKAQRATKAAHNAKAQAEALALAQADEGSDEGDEGATPARRGQWAAEKARAIAQGTAGKSAFRFAKLADVLLLAELQGETRIAFAEANKRADLARGERGEPAASWRLALQRTRQLADGIGAWQVDADASALVLRK